MTLLVFGPPEGSAMSVDRGERPRTLFIHEREIDMQELVIDEVEQVSGGLTYYYTYKGVVIVGDDAVMPSPGPVIPEMA